MIDINYSRHFTFHKDCFGNGFEETIGTFVAMVEDMRTAQTNYFATRSPSALNKSKQLERHVDDVINQWRSGKPSAVQGELI